MRAEIARRRFEVGSVGKGGTTKGGPMYIGIGTLVFILLILLVIYFVRRV